MKEIFILLATIGFSVGCCIALDHAVNGSYDGNIMPVRGEHSVPSNFQQRHNYNGHQ